MRRRALALALGAVLVCGGVVLWRLRGAGEWGFRRALPASASDVHEASWEDDLLPDYQYCLKARITCAEFDAYARRFALTPAAPGRVYDDEQDWSGLDCLPGSEPWWNPPPTRDGVLIGQSGDTWTTAAYHDGYLYLSSINH
jgi:hypothetical protein